MTKKSDHFNAICEETELYILLKEDVSIQHDQLLKTQLLFEDRINIFYSLYYHMLQAEDDHIMMRDIYYWFPECKQIDIPDSLPVPKHIIEKGFEFFLAELLENSETHIWRYF
tara:strand:+ start:83 stop:421 length:339 start_codon:yes stop_codon:yes gene_type:complete